MKQQRPITKHDEEVGVYISSLLYNIQEGFIFQMTPLLDMADGHAKDIEQEIKRRKWFKHLVKKQFNETVAILHRDCPKARSGGDGLSFIDYLDNTTESLEKHVDRLYWAIKNAMDRHNVEDSAFLAKIELTGTLITLAFHIYRQTIAYAKCRIYQHTDLAKMVSTEKDRDPELNMYAYKSVNQRIAEFVDNKLGYFFNPQASYMAWCKLMGALPSKLTINRERITEDKNVQLGMKNIYTQLSSRSRVLADMNNEHQ